MFSRETKAKLCVCVCVERERKRETDRQTEEKGRKQRGRKEVKKRDLLRKLAHVFMKAENMIMPSVS
jgi:hypothetical protein